ncbi:hypothetical protein Acr_08g0013170 [Actinidia rufa]|uniref:Retrotransposon gag domain-containing protein n=1 Tax=Actinidia rufa TaxID=165716 RepID=A0A7J0F2J3_9ERIC|nr:hypothetical protein Acr_08g0013170 [Actinidia rufa]
MVAEGGSRWGFPVKITKMEGLNDISPATRMVRMDSRGDGELCAGREWIRLLTVEIFGCSQNGIGLRVWGPANDRRHGNYRRTPDGEGNALVVFGGDLVVAGGRVVATGKEREAKRNMPPRNSRGRAKSLTGARGARGECGARRNHDEEDDGNHQESVMGGGASALGGNVGGAPPTTLGGAEFMQGVFTAIEQVVRNTVQTMQVPVRTAESRATTAMKAFLQLRPPTFKGEPEPLVAEDWLEQVTRALDTILVTEEDLRVLFASYQLQGDALQWWKTMEEVVAKKWEPFKKAFLDQYFTDMAKEALRMEFINLVQGTMTVAQYEAKFTSLSRFAKAFVSTEEEKAKQFMRGLRSSIRNKIAGNLIKVYSTMVSAAAAIEETLNETRKIQNPKSQREGTSNQSEGRSSKKPRNFTTQQQYPARSSPATSVVSSGQTSLGRADLFWLSSTRSSYSGLPTEGSATAVAAGGTISHSGTGTITSQGATYLLSVWSGGSYQSTVHTEGKQSGSYGIATTHSVSFKPQGHSSIYISTQTSYQSRPQAVAQQGQRTQGRVYAITSAAGPSGIAGTARAAIGYLCCARYFTYRNLHLLFANLDNPNDLETTYLAAVEIPNDPPQSEKIDVKIVARGPRELTNDVDVYDDHDRLPKYMQSDHDSQSGDNSNGQLPNISSGNSMMKSRNALLLIATVLATVTFQVPFHNLGRTSEDSSKAGTDGLRQSEFFTSRTFIFFNSIVFVASVVTSLFLLHEFPMKPLPQISISALFGSYMFSIKATSPNEAMPLLLISILFFLLAATGKIYGFATQRY